jgi:PAT family beta-lactamase induction signal transducer AmpG
MQAHTHLEHISMSSILKNSKGLLPNPALHRIHIWRMGFFGGISAIPLAFLLSIVTVWLTDYGCSPQHMGGMAWMMLPYALKIFLGPIIQMTSFGPLGRRYGHYFVWILMAQWGVIACMIALSFLNPTHRWSTTLGICFAMALCGAVQDCALEGYRISATSESDQSATSGSNAVGYRIGMWATSYSALILAHHYGWSVTFYSIAGLLMFVGLISVQRLPQPKQWKEVLSMKEYFRLLHQGWQFFHKTYFFMAILGMIGAQKLGDIFLRSMWSHYLIKAGYTKQAIANVDKGLGIIATIIGIRFGVAWIERKGIAHGFRFWAILQGLMACLFMAHAWHGRQNFALFCASVSLNHLVGGLGNVTIITYISNLCKASDKEGTLHYAMLSSLGSFGRTVVSYGACLVASSVSWPVFFLISALMCLPALAMSYIQWPFKKRCPKNPD